MINNKNKMSPAVRIAFVGIAAATVECGKLALSALPNIEVVTLLLALYGYVFGGIGIWTALVFVCIEPLIYGFGSWTLAYILYWPFVALIFALLGKIKIKNRLVLTATAVLLTVWFGVLTALIEVGLFSGSFDNFLYRFGIYYARGIVFYLLQIVTNAVLFPLLFRFLSEKLSKIKGKI